MFIDVRGKYVNLDHVAVAEVVESRGVRAVLLRDQNGKELGTVLENEFRAAMDKGMER